MKCAAHTLQLAVKDAMTQCNCRELVQAARRVSVAARTPTINNTLLKNNCKKAILDVPTRWGSSYEMVERLLELKSKLIDIHHPGE